MLQTMIWSIYNRSPQDFNKLKIQIETSNDLRQTFNLGTNTQSKLPEL